MVSTDMMMPIIVSHDDDFWDCFTNFCWDGTGVAQIFFEDDAMDKLKQIQGWKENGDYWEDGKINGNQLQEVTIAKTENWVGEWGRGDIFVEFAFLWKIEMWQLEQIWN